MVRHIIICLCAVVLSSALWLGLGARAGYDLLEFWPELLLSLPLIWLLLETLLAPHGSRFHIRLGVVIGLLIHSGVLITFILRPSWSHAQALLIMTVIGLMLIQNHRGMRRLQDILGVCKG